MLVGQAQRGQQPPHSFTIDAPPVCLEHMVESSVPIGRLRHCRLVNLVLEGLLNLLTLLTACRRSLVVPQSPIGYPHYSHEASERDLRLYWRIYRGDLRQAQRLESFFKMSISNAFSPKSFLSWSFSLWSR